MVFDHDSSINLFLVLLSNATTTTKCQNLSRSRSSRRYTRASTVLAQMLVSLTLIFPDDTNDYTSFLRFSDDLLEWHLPVIKAPVTTTTISRSSMQTAVCPILKQPRTRIPSAEPCLPHSLSLFVQTPSARTSMANLVDQRLPEKTRSFLRLSLTAWFIALLSFSSRTVSSRFH